MLRSVPVQATSVVKIAPGSGAIRATEVTTAPISAVLKTMKVQRNLDLSRDLFLISWDLLPPASSGSLTQIRPETTGRGWGYEGQIRPSRATRVGVLVRLQWSKSSHLNH